MDIQSFIESGLLESYALNLCSASERDQVEKMLAQYPEARTELAAIEQALEQYATAASVAPPPGLKDNIMREIDRMPRPPGSNNMMRLFQVIFLALLASTAILAYQFTQTSRANQTQQQQIAQLEQQLVDCNTRDQRAQNIVDVVRNPNTIPIKMSNETDAPAYVFHNKSDNCTALLDVSALPTQPSGKYLQFWALVDGLPVSMGMIQADTSGFQSFPCVANAAGFAVSIEDKKEGNPIPTVVLMAGLAG